MSNAKPQNTPRETLKGPLILIDGSSWLYRAYHVLPPLTNGNNGNNEPTGAIYGMTNMLRKFLREYEADRVVVVFDPRGGTFRNELFADYKANRPPVPEELSAQFEGIKAVIAALGLPMLQVKGVEADDVIGTLTVRDGGEVLIVTGDKDMAQLVNARVSLLDTMQDRVTDETRVQEKFGVGPDLITDFLALVGDSSDNIPGVDKVGPKTAAKWLNQYGSLQGVIDNADKIGGKIRNHLWQEKVPMVAVVGDQEFESGTVTVRSRVGGDLGTMTVEAFGDLLEKMSADRA